MPRTTKGRQEKHRMHPIRALTLDNIKKFGEELDKLLPHGIPEWRKYQFEDEHLKTLSDKKLEDLLWAIKGELFFLRPKGQSKPNPKSHTEVKWLAKLPKCDFCDKPAQYDGKTRMGPWGYMCPAHFRQHGIGLGLGKGQKLIPLQKNIMVRDIDVKHIKRTEDIGCGKRLEPRMMASYRPSGRIMCLECEMKQAVPSSKLGRLSKEITYALGHRRLQCGDSIRIRSS